MKSQMTRFIKADGCVVEGMKLPGRGFYVCGKEKCRDIFSKKWRVRK